MATVSPEKAAALGYKLICPSAARYKGRCYFRKATSEQISPRLKEFQSCMKEGMKDRTFTDIEEVNKEFKKLAKSCKRE